jgi:uncharacterized membrane protein YidH (DUF202 family)
MTTSDLLLVSKYGEFGTFFSPKQTLCILSQLFTGVLFCHYYATIQRKRRKKKHSSSHTAIECGFFLVVVVVVVGLGS